MKVALVQCPSWGTYDPPLALVQLSSCLREAGYEVYVFDLNIKLYLKRDELLKNVWAWEQSDFWFNQDSVRRILDAGLGEVEGCLNQIIGNDIRVVGLSVNINSELFSLEFSKRLKQKRKDTIIVWGGPLFFRRNSIESVLTSGVVDVVISGEGEIAFVEFLETLKRGKDFSTSPGIAFKRNGQVCKASPAEPVVLDNLPFLDFTLLPLEDYDDSEHIPMMANRGCIKRCVFCSDMPCWSTFKSMSGRRIFEEIGHQRKVQLTHFGRELSHVDFVDLVFNGNMKSLVDFCDLMIKADLDLYWTANMCIRPEVTGRVIDKMKLARCEHILIGIESGSERVLKLMNKYYKISDADRIVRQLSEAGICVTANFMFGFPGETDEDFQKTLDFLKRNAVFLSRVYPSRTYCALEEFSYLESHLEEFGIKPNPPNHLFWETVDGANTYPVRMDWCRRFCELALQLGIEVGAGVQTAVELDEWYNLGHYYETVGDCPKAIESLLKYFQLEPRNECVRGKLESYLRRIESGELSIHDELLNRLKERTNTVVSQREQFTTSCVDRLGHGYSLGVGKAKLRNLQDEIINQDYSKLDFRPFQDNWSMAKGYIDNFYERRKEKIVKELIKMYAQAMRTLVSKNKQLNNKEFEERKIYLRSYPSSIFFQTNAPCQSFCIFNLNSSKNEYLDLSYFQNRIKAKMNYGLGLAERFIFVNSGEFFLLPDWQGILDYLDFNYPHVQKVLSTDGSSLKPDASDAMTFHISPYVVNIWLYASNDKLHKTITRTNNFEQIMEQIGYLLRVRKNTGNICVNFGFIASNLTLEDLGDFIRLASKMEVDKVIVRYNAIHSQTQKYLSCFFNQDFANETFNSVEKLAKDLNIEIDLPPRFAQDNYAAVNLCRELWNQIKFDRAGNLLDCNGGKLENLNLDNYDYEGLWNSSYYQTMRRQVLEKERLMCFANCHRVNPACINNFVSHIYPESRNKEIDIFWGDNF